MKRIFAVVLMVVCGVFAFAQTKPTVVIVPFDSRGIDQGEVEVLFEVFQSEFANTGKAKVVDRSSLDKIRKQQEFQTSDWSNADKVAELGKALNASLVVTGQIMDFKGQIVTTIKLIDVNTTEIVSSVVERVRDTTVLFDKLPAMAQELSKNAFKKQMKYKIGDTGPGGGIIFYVSEEGFNVHNGNGGIRKCNYLEVSKEDIGNLPFCPCDVNYYKDFCYIGTQNDLGYGKVNSYRIINGKHKHDLDYGGKKFETVYCNSNDCAAYACLNYKTDTASDWFLPSLEELKFLYQNLGDTILLNSKNVYFATSAEVNSGEDYEYYWGLYRIMAFTDIKYNVEGKHLNNDSVVKAGAVVRWSKEHKVAVRAVRAFAEE